MTEAMQQLIEMMAGNKPRYAIMNPHDYFAIMAKMKSRNAVSRMKRVVKDAPWRMQRSKPYENWKRNVYY